MRGIIGWEAKVITEIIIFETIWLLMVWSHSYCMCTEPGFIPKNYKYQTEKLPAKFREAIGPNGRTDIELGKRAEN